MTNSMGRQPPQLPVALVKTRPHRTPHPVFDEATQAWAVRVPLPCGATAQLDYDDFATLMGGGWSDQMFYHSNGRGRSYVRTSRIDVPGHVATVARLLTKGEAGTRVRYADGDPLNLRRLNLKVGPGASKGREARALANDADGED